MLGKISVLKHVSGMFRPGYEFGLPRVELEQIAGFWPDIEKSRAEAKGLLAEAGAANLKLRLVNRNLGDPHTPAAIYLIDQWRRIGVEAEHVQLETKAFYDAHAGGNFDVVMDFISDFADDPSAQFDKFLSAGKSAQSVSRHTNVILDDLFDRQARSIDPMERRMLVRQFETRGLAQAYSAPILWWNGPVASASKVGSCTQAISLASTLSTCGSISDHPEACVLSKPKLICASSGQCCVAIACGAEGEYGSKFPVARPPAQRTIRLRNQTFYSRPRHGQKVPTTNVPAPAK